VSPLSLCASCLKTTVLGCNTFQIINFGLAMYKPGPPWCLVLLILPAKHTFADSNGGNDSSSLTGQ
jgi:hypothetical protein